MLGRHDRYPLIETGAALVMLLAVLAFATYAPGCADTGSRGSAVPQAQQQQVGDWHISWWPGATFQEQTWLTETVAKHDDLLRSLIPGRAVYRGSITFYEQRREVDQAWFVTRSAYTGLPHTIVNVGLAVRLAFSHPLDADIHMWAGPKLEGHGLLHLMLHTVIGDWGHSDPRWLTVDALDAALSHQIASQR